MSRPRSRSHCWMAYDEDGYSIHVSGSSKWVRQEFPKLLATMRKEMGK